jgi:hypothetical protein
MPNSPTPLRETPLRETLLALHDYRPSANRDRCGDLGRCAFRGCPDTDDVHTTRHNIHRILALATTPPLDRRTAALYFLGPFGRDAGWTTDDDSAWIAALAQADHFIAEYARLSAKLFSPRDDVQGADNIVGSRPPKMG